MPKASFMLKAPIFFQRKVIFNAYLDYFFTSPPNIFKIITNFLIFSNGPSCDF